MSTGTTPKRVFWIASSRKDIQALPSEVRKTFGFALWQAQMGRRHIAAKPLKGFGGGRVLEVVEDQDASTYRAVYTVRFAGAVYVLHVFQKKSKTRAKTPRHDIERLRTRLKAAEEHYAEWSKEQESKKSDSRENHGRTKQW
jgi:phage-related protein